MRTAITLKVTSEEVGIYSVENVSGKKLGKVYELKAGGTLFIGIDNSITHFDVKETTF